MVVFILSTERTYPHAESIIKASWNWPYNRKDMAVYGGAGYAITKDAREMRVKGSTVAKQTLVLRPEVTGTYTSAFLYFTDLIRGRLKVPP